MGNTLSGFVGLRENTDTLGLPGSLSTVDDASKIPPQKGPSKIFEKWEADFIRNSEYEVDEVIHAITSMRNDLDERLEFAIGYFYLHGQDPDALAWWHNRSSRLEMGKLLRVTLEEYLELITLDGFHSFSMRLGEVTNVFMGHPIIVEEEEEEENV